MIYHRYETKLGHTSMLMIPISFIKTRMLKEIEKVLNKEFSSLFDWFLNNKLSIRFGGDKSNTIFFSRRRTQPKLSISYRYYSLKQRNTVKYPRYYLDSYLKGNSMTRRALKKD